jgi:hypothetical protein
LGSVSSLVSEKKIFEISNSSCKLKLDIYVLIFSSPGPGELLASVACKLFPFQASSPKPLGQLEPNLAGMYQVAHCQKIGEQNNLKVFVSKKTKGSKQNSII